MCWAYAISTMLRASIRSAVQKYHIENGLKMLDDPDHHKRMRKELCMNIFPFGNDGTDLSTVIKLVIAFLTLFVLFTNKIKLTTPSSLLDAGINRLHTVTSILKKFDFEPQLFVNPQFEKEEKETPYFSGNFEGKVQYFI